MLCQKCQTRQATVHLQQIVNGKVTELYLCSECAAQLEKPVSFEEFFQGLLSAFGVPVQQVPASDEEAQGTTCPTCGLTYEDFRKTGKLGCADCYQTFHRELEGILKNVQGSNRHEGKFPHKAGEGVQAKRKITKLRMELTKAIDNEEYEEAAHLRDQIKELEAQQQ